ncbi:MAG: hypothetical protein J5I53_02250 [Bradyrhizobiaceae bacterium]|nr:hypothetical protein [Bradyrhizobiaceae bacterium]
MRMKRTVRHNHAIRSTAAAKLAWLAKREGRSKLNMLERLIEVAYTQAKQETKHHTHQQEPEE